MLIWDFCHLFHVKFQDSKTELYLDVLFLFCWLVWVCFFLFEVVENFIGGVCFRKQKCTTKKKAVAFLRVIVASEMRDGKQ